MPLVSHLNSRTWRRTLRKSSHSENHTESHGLQIRNQVLFRVLLKVTQFYSKDWLLLNYLTVNTTSVLKSEVSESSTQKSQQKCTNLENQEQRKRRYTHRN